MKIALEVWSSDYQQTLATCVRAEQLGFHAFYHGESPHDLNLECWTTLAALAQATEHIRLGPVITNVLPTYRSPALMVRQAQAVWQISSGRLDFRTGVGADHRFGQAWWGRHGIDYPPYEQRLVDLITLLDLLETELPDLPVTIAATGSRALTLAAERADVWETSFCTPSEFADRDRMMVEAHDDRRPLRSLEIDGFLATEPDSLVKLLDQVAADRGATEDLAPVMQRALTGLPGDVAGQLGQLSAVGVDQIVVAFHDPHDPNALEALAKAVELYRLNL